MAREKVARVFAVYLLMGLKILLMLLQLGTVPVAFVPPI